MNQEALIEKYILGTLTSEEKEQVAKWLETDTSFKTELEFQTNLKRALEKGEDEAFKTTLKELEPGRQTPSKRPIFKWAIAASIIVLVVVGTLLFQPSQNKSLFAQNFQPYANVIQPVVRGENLNDVTTQAFLAYENAEFELAETHFTTMVNSTNDSYALFYLANVKLALEKPDDAISLFHSYMTTGENLSSQAQWYVALAYLQLDDPVEAKVALKKIIRFEGYGAAEAAILLEGLK